MECIKSSVIAFFGKPNVGKSTLFNLLQKNIYAIVTNKAQTTRNYIVAKSEIRENEFMILLDTPGFHDPNNKLDAFLNSEVKYALKQANTCCYISDPSAPITNEDHQILTYIKNLKDKELILIINKIDLCNDQKIQERIDELNKIVNFNKVFKISALNKINIQELNQYLESTIKERDININYFNEPSDSFVAKEIIREACILNLKHEVPYGISVIVNKFDYDQNQNRLDIEADIYTERESQKGIVVGQKGMMIKKIGTEARMKLLNIYDCKINLKLYVKTKSDWRQDNELVKLMGYRK